jgi:uncharacterized membrane protein YkoI
MKNRLAAAGVLAGLVGGGALGVILGVPGISSAQTSPSTTVSSATSATDSIKDSARTNESPLTGDDLAKATAAAAKAAPGSTVERAETDDDGDAFEVHVTNADGTKSTVKLNADFSVKTVEAGGKGGGPHQANGKTETPLTGDDLAKATAAAATAAPGSTVERAETDADGDAFEVHVTNADGTKSTVKLNADFSVKTVEAGGKGGHGDGHGKGHGKGRGQNDAPATTTAPTTTA